VAHDRDLKPPASREAKPLQQLHIFILYVCATAGVFRPRRLGVFFVFLTSTKRTQMSMLTLLLGLSLASPHDGKSAG